MKKRSKIKLSIKQILLIVLLASISLTILISLLIKSVNKWFNTHYFQFNQVVEVQLNKPIEVKERKITVTEVINILNEVEPLENLTPIEEYICEKWGVYECKVAIAVAKAEGLNHPPDGFNINTNNTIDVGYFRINSVHFGKEGCHLEDVIDPYGNVDCAYGIWEDQGWTPWVAYNNGNFKHHLK